MTIAVLPFNAGPDTKPSLARQLANFASDIVRNNTGAEINSVNYLVRLDEGPNPRLANVNPSESLNDPQMLGQLYQQSPGLDLAMDGLLTFVEGKYRLDLRFFGADPEQPIDSRVLEFTEESPFGALREMIEALARHAGQSLPDTLKENVELFGTDNGPAFLKFLEGYDAIQYIDKTQGRVAMEFVPGMAMQTLAEALDLDLDWEAPYVSLVQLCRMCVQMQIGNPEDIEKHLKLLVDKVPDDGRGVFALGEFYAAVNNHAGAAEMFEKALKLEPNEPAIYTRLGISQLAMGMPVNAERNFRKAVSMEGDDKPSMDFLAQVLQQTNRAHEVPALWKEVVAQNPQNGQARAKLAIAYINAGQEEDGLRAFDEGLEVLEDNSIIKRYYAPVLAQKQEFDRAMDFYEDCLEVAPTDIPLLIEYAQTLQAAGRDFEVPKVLSDILAANPDPNTRAQALAWQIELEQPKRVEAVQNAQKKLDAEDYAGAVRELKPLKNWLADYWKMWALLAASLNRQEQYAEAEEAAKRLIELFPGCEPAYGEIATALSGQGKHEEAYNAMRFGMTQVQNSLPIALNLALAAKRVGRIDEAKALARQIREAVGPNEQIDPILDDIEK